MPTVRCPTCRRPVEWEGNSFRPFCSERCQVVDLGNWAAERYRVKGEPIPEDEEGANGRPVAPEDETDE